jgi:Glycosyltransferase family 17
VRIWDTVIIGSERDLDLLHAREAEFADHDAVHVIAEATHGYDGQPKPLWFWENRKAFTHGRWNHVRVEDRELPPPGDNPKARKDALREYLFHALTAAPDDIVLHGGTDEIPSAAVFDRLDGIPVLPVAMQMRLCAYTARLVHPVPWKGTAAIRRSGLVSLTKLREERHLMPSLVSAGTRLAAMGEELRTAYEDGVMLRVREVDGTWPRWVAGGKCPASWLAG